MDLFNAPAGIYYLANTPHAHCSYAKYVLILGAFAEWSAVNSKLLKMLWRSCAFYRLMAKLLFYNFYQALLGYFTSHLLYHHIKDPGGYRKREAKRGGKKKCMCWRASRQSGNSSLYLVELKQYKDHFLYCWKHLDICTNLINARMWLLFVLSQLFLRRRYCSCSTDVSIIPHWVQEFAYYQGLPCLGMLIKSVHWRLRDQSPHLSLDVISKPRLHISQKNANPSSCSAWINTAKGEALELQLMSSHCPWSNPKNPKLKSPQSPPLHPLQKKKKKKMQILNLNIWKHLVTGFPNCHTLPLTPACFLEKFIHCTTKYF